jgi:hypothetical protein
MRIRIPCLEQAVMRHNVEMDHCVIQLNIEQIHTAVDALVLQKVVDQPSMARAIGCCISGI